MSAHDSLRDRIARHYFSLGVLDCQYCKHLTELPLGGVRKVITEYAGNGYRADVAALDEWGEPVCVIEVVNKNPPATAVLRAQSQLQGAFYVEMDTFDDGFRGYCSPFCWQHREQENASILPTCTDCERPFCWLEWSYQLVDWENPYYRVVERGAVPIIDIRQTMKLKGLKKFYDEGNPICAGGFSMESLTRVDGGWVYVCPFDVRHLCEHRDGQKLGFVPCTDWKVERDSNRNLRTSPEIPRNSRR